jgi:metal-responsive CopG/Arc/MetJ family transcriptional regulator
MDRINVRVDRIMKQRLEAEAQLEGVSSSDLVRAAIEAYLNARPKRESCFDIAVRIGMVGCAKDLPRDASTNKKYFDGFGRD